MPAGAPRHGLARILSKRGLCSRSVAAAWIAAGRVSVDGRRIYDPEQPTRPDADIRIDGQAGTPGERQVLALNKPRGLVTTRADERGRATVYDCLRDLGAQAPWLAPIGRLDQASEGLLLFCNDPAFGARLNDPRSQLPKTYHVQVDRVADAALLDALRAGVKDQGEWLRAESVELLRSGQRNSWLQFVLTEGRNRQLRRMLAAHGVEVLRLLRVAIGPLPLGTLPKGGHRWLQAGEIEALERAAGAGAGASSWPKEELRPAIKPACGSRLK